MKLLKKTAAGQRRVYDIEVEGVHNFYANGINVHNCATDGGVSVIKDDGAVVDSANTNTVYRVLFADQNLVWCPTATPQNWFLTYNPGGLQDGFGYDEYLRREDTSVGDYPRGPQATSGKTRHEYLGRDVFATSNSIASAPYSNGVFLYRRGEHVAPGRNKGMIAKIQSGFGTGWMNGDIKGAFLSDTDDTDLVGGTDNDRSVNANPLTVNGTVTRSPVATGADLVAYSGFSASNYLEQPYNPDLDFGTGDYCVMGWVKTTDDNAYLWQRNDSTGAGEFFQCNIGHGIIAVRDSGGINTVSVDVGDDVWHLVCQVRRSGNLHLYIDGVDQGSVASASDLDNTTATFSVGSNAAAGGSAALNLGSLALLRISATAPTDEQIAKIYEDEKVLFQENAACTLYGTSDAVTALAHDPDTDLLHVGTSDGRSVFRGLERIQNTTTSVSKAISASGGLVAEK